MPKQHRLRLVELLDIANESYPDGFLAEYYDCQTGEPRQGSGDTLARYIVAELRETFRPRASRDAQLREGRDAIELLQEVMEGLR